MPDSPPPDNIQLTHEETDRLRVVLETWAAKSRAEKREAKEALVEEFITARGIDDSNRYAREFLRIKITHWFSNNAPSKDSRLPRSLRTIWTGRDVFNIRRQAEIAARQKDLLDRGVKTVPIAALNTARAQLWGALSPDEKEEFEREADEWTDEGPDQDLRAMIAEKRLGDWVSSFIALLWNQAGAVSELTFYYLSKDNKMKWGRYDISMHWNRHSKKNPKFVDLFPRWKQDYYNTFARYAHITLFPEDADPENEKGLSRKRPPRDIVFERYADGTPILPPINEFRLQTEKESVMRAFMTLHWSLASGIKDAPVAWAEVANHPDQYFREGLFVDVHVVEPTRMTVKPMRKWWNRVLELQETGDPDDRFRFTHWWDGSERHEAQYGTPVVEKNAEKAQQDRRARAANGPPKGAFEAWTGQTARAGQPGSPGSPGSAVSDSEEPEEPSAAGKRKRGFTQKGNSLSAAFGGAVAGPSKPKGTAARRLTTKKAAPGAGRPAKKKARTAPDESSNSAQSSEAGSDGEGSPELPSDDSPDEFNFDDLSGTDDGAPPLVGNGGTRSKGKQPLRRARAPLLNIGRTSPPTGPFDDLPEVPSEPDASLVKAAHGQPPSWVGHSAERVWPYLWALSNDVSYRQTLVSWKHMFARRTTFKTPGPGGWAQWESKAWGISAEEHRDRGRVEKVFEWLRANVPTPNASPSEVQQWMLAMGVTLRDAHTVNSIDPSDDNEPVPNGGPGFLRGSVMTFRDILRILEPLCRDARGPNGLPEQVLTPRPQSDLLSSIPQPSTSATGPVPLSTSSTPSLGPTSGTSTLTSLPPTANTRTSLPLRGQRGRPPGRRTLTRSPSHGGSSEEVEQQVDEHFADDGAGKHKEAQSISEGLLAQRPRQRRQPRSKVVVEIPASAIARRTRGKAGAHQPDPPAEPGETPGPSEPAPLARVRRSERTKNMNSKKR